MIWSPKFSSSRQQLIVTTGSCREAQATLCDKTGHLSYTRSEGQLAGYWVSLVNTTQRQQIQTKTKTPPFSNWNAPLWIARDRLLRYIICGTYGLKWGVAGKAVGLLCYLQEVLKWTSDFFKADPRVRDKHCIALLVSNTKTSIAANKNLIQAASYFAQKNGLVMCFITLLHCCIVALLH